MAEEMPLNGNIFFLGLARASTDRTLLAEHQVQGHIDSAAVAQMLRVLSNALTPGQGYTFAADNCAWCLKQGFD